MPRFLRNYFRFFVKQRKIKTKKENTKSFLQKKIGIRIPTPPFTLHFHFPFIFTFFIFICLTKSKNTMQIFPHFFRHLFRILFLTSHDYENKIQKWVMISFMSDDFIVPFSYPFLLFSFLLALLFSLFIFLTKVFNNC